MLRVIDIDYLKDYELLVTFNDGNQCCPKRFSIKTKKRK